jgi:hypothetical protein
MKLFQRWKQTALHNKALVMTSILVAFGTLFYAAAAVVQICIMNKSAKESAAQIDRLVGATDASIKKAVDTSSNALTTALQQNKEALDASLSQAKSSLDASTRQGKAALDASIAASLYELRPYLMSSKMDMIGDFLADGPFQGKIEIINGGRTPATKVDGCADIIYRPRDMPIPDDYPCPSPTNPPTLLHIQPTGEHSLSNIGPGEPPFILLTPPTSLNIKVNDRPLGSTEKQRMFATDGPFRLYLYGEFSYEDIVGTNRVHHTRFCGRYNPATHVFDVCEKHNNVD